MPGTSSNSGGQTYPVGHLKPNAWGLFDMLGTLGSGVGTGTTITTRSRRGPVGRVVVASPRVNRGGSWYDDPFYCRPAFRNRYEPGNRGNYLGFRVAAVQAG